METITVTCVGMGYDDKREAVSRFWKDYLGDVDVAKTLCLIFHPTNPHDPNAIAVAYCPRWTVLGPPTVEEINYSDVDDDETAPWIIGYITKDDIPAFTDLWASLMDNDWATAEVTFEIDELRTKSDFPTWMILTLTIHD